MNHKKNIIIFIFFIYLKTIYCSNFSYGIQFSRSFQLNNGNIIIAGNTGIYTYDNSGLISLFNYTINEKISEIEDACYTTFAQFPKEYNEVVVILVMHVIYIFDSKGKFVFKTGLNIGSPKFNFYTIVPIIYKDEKYYFILGYINSNSKAFLQYISFTTNNQQFTYEDCYEFDQNNTQRKNVHYDYGITCQLMDHYIHNEVLTCFYQNNDPKQIAASSFKLNNNKIENLFLNSSYNDSAFVIQSTISSNKKKSLVCYVRNNQNDSNDHFGYCAIYDIDKNKFDNYNKYISRQTCGTQLNNIYLNYFKETGEYIFSCTSYENGINIMKFNDNFEIITINDTNNTAQGDSYIPLDDSCQFVKIYSFVLISNEYKIIADYSCNNNQITSLYSISEEFKPTIVNKDKDNSHKSLGKCYFTCQSCTTGPEKNNNNCLTCKDNFELNQNNNCIYKYNFYWNSTINQIIFLLENEFCPEKLPYEKMETKQCVESCTNEEFINKICIINHYSENNINLITEQLRNIIYEVTGSKYDVIIDGNNIIYEITTTSTNNEYHNISLIDFGECEKILKEHYSIEYLIVFKRDVKLNDSYPLIVEYEVYSPETKEKLNLSLCENKNIDIYIPLFLDNYTYNLYNSMNEFGIDILNENNSFYNDICTPFSTDEGTDITLSDRQKTYYNENITLCENNCKYIYYNSSNGKAKCQCILKNEISNIKIISYDNMDINNFFDIKTISNIEIMKCYKLTFSKDGINNNYGNIILIIFIILFISLIIYYHINEKTEISRILRITIKSNYINNPIRKSIKKNKNIITFKINNLNRSKSKHSSQTIQDLIKENNLINNENNLNNININRYQNINVINNANIIFESNKDKTNQFHKRTRKTNKKSTLKNIDIYSINKNITKHEKNEIIKNNNELKYNEFELNNLPYNEALLIDKRTYLQYYWSLIKNKHIVLFIFMPTNDYNLISIKIGLFIFSFCLYFTVNAFFFTDKTMHKIYEDKGIFNFIFQLPSMIYSTLISTVINILIKKLALSEKNMLELKQITIKKIALEKTVKLYRRLMIKFNLFFYISLLLLIFFWYYISTFCAVYKNTQIILIENTLTSFAFSLIYPFGFNLIPGIFRIPTLKSNKKNECLYNVGNIIALL